MSAPCIGRQSKDRDSLAVNSAVCLASASLLETLIFLLRFALPIGTTFLGLAFKFSQPELK